MALASAALTTSSNADLSGQNLVTTAICSRSYLAKLLKALPTSSSACPPPYISDVSRTHKPRATALPKTAKSFSSLEGSGVQSPPPRPEVPSPSAVTHPTALAHFLSNSMSHRSSFN